MNMPSDPKVNVHAAGSSAREQEREWVDGLHRSHLARARKTTLAVRITQALLLVLFFGAWELAGRNKWIDVLLFSYPTKLFDQLWRSLMDGSLLPHTGITVLETIVGFLLGTLLGTAIAALLWWFSFISRVADPYLVVLNSMPKVALGPLFIVGFGPGMLAIVMTTLSVTVIITTIVIYNRFRDVTPGYIKVVRLFGGSKWQVFRYVVLPDSFAVIVSQLKVNVGLAWVGVIVGEFLTSKSGLGYLIIYGFQVFNFTIVLSSLLVIAVVATVMYRLVAALEHWLTRGGRER
ncbi:ABC transporter permease [Paenibacillus methanolicus]|uniref:NitT/TauT family transport system permease protein n=1 Tax=Paenibacillus methanolicus TaxID=582686 RepID=A0A5S5BZW9_9BACL|nr:ABC transporter permease [Paenibacillus methanolicus]TYP72577.1 NitT/TauT family transport system permease protein [Paenibacillus methanolicus]